MVLSSIQSKFGAREGRGGGGGGGRERVLHMIQHIKCKEKSLEQLLLLKFSHCPLVSAWIL